MIVKNYLNRKIPTPLAILIILFLSILVGRTTWFNYIEINSERIGASEVKIPKKQGGLSIDKLENAEYKTCWNSNLGKVKFTNGSFVKPPTNPQSATGGWSITIVKDKMSSGDLNNDGKEDDVLVLNSSGGGSGSFYEIIAVINKNEEPLYFNCAPLGDRIKINSIDIKSGKIIVDMITHTPEDPMCCPTIRKTVNYQIIGNELVEI
jgi:hypothetical protein